MYIYIYIYAHIHIMSTSISNTMSLQIDFHSICTQRKQDRGICVPLCVHVCTRKTETDDRHDGSRAEADKHFHPFIHRFFESVVVLMSVFANVS